MKAFLTVIASLTACTALYGAPSPQSTSPVRKHVPLNNGNSVFAQHVKEFEAMVAADPKNVSARVCLGNAYLEQHKFGDAFKQYKTAIQIDPTYPRSYYNLGLLYYATEDYPSSIQCNQTAVRYAPNYYMAWYNLGISNREIGKYQEEIAAMRKAAELAPMHMNPWLEIGDAYNELHDTDNAVKAYLIHLKLHPSDTNVRHLTVTHLLDLHQPDDALRLATAGLKAAVTEYDRAFMQASIFVCQGRYQEAMRLFDKCHGLSPNEWGPYWSYSVTLYDSGDHASARAVWRSMLASNDTRHADWARRQLANNP
ncbi:MAG TPA: tetratricopeptide repeat protein [Capsulimonadaceae bacterium]